MKTATQRARAVRSPDEIRAELIEMDLTEEEKPIAGYAFGFGKEPHNAMSFYMETHGGAEPRRFYIAQRMYVVAE